jgi:hypothetical protein
VPVPAQLGLSGPRVQLLLDACPAQIHQFLKLHANRLNVPNSFGLPMVQLSFALPAQSSEPLRVPPVPATAPVDPIGTLPLVIVLTVEALLLNFVGLPPHAPHTTWTPL